MTDSSSASLCAPVSPAHCAAVDGEYVHGADSLAWGPHNVLLVATRWAVFLHVKSLLAPDAAVRPGLSTDPSPQAVGGAKWALGLASYPAAYPAACRLFVRATRDAFVYCVTRTGTGRVKVSAGVTLSGAGAAAVAYEWFPRDVLVLVTARGVHLFAFDVEPSEEGDNNDTSCRAIDDAAAVFLFTDGPPPTSASRVARNNHNSNYNSNSNSNNNGSGQERLVVASVHELRVFAISEESVRLLHTVDVPYLRGIPTALSSFSSSSISRGGGGDDNNDDDDDAVDVFIAAPLVVLRGTIAAAEAARWTTTAVWETGGALGDDVCVRHFFAVPLDSVLRSPLDSSALVAAARRGADGFAVLGMSQRRLFAFVGLSCVELFRCLRHDGRHLLPSHTPLELWGVAVHPSLGLATLGLAFGRRHYPTVQLLSVAAGTPAGFLARLLHLLLPQDEGSAKGARGKRPRSTYGRGHYHNCGGGLVDAGLWNRQASTSCFLWEDLLPMSMLATESARNCDPAVAEALRQKYLSLREQYGVHLFIRYDENDAVWRQTLLHIMRRVPGDLPVLEELYLANAVQVVAAGVCYTGFTRTSDEQGAGRYGGIGGSSCAIQGFAAAMEYIRLYRESRQSNAEVWSHTVPFAEQLGCFLATVESESVKKHISVAKGARFPCSVCNKSEQVTATLSLSSTTVITTKVKGKLNTVVKKAREEEKGGVASPLGCADGVHHTVFSGKTFIPISFLAQDEVVSRCCVCRTYDYVSGPFCVVCDGLML